MKLYSRALSNFASKSRIAIREKGLTVEIVDPPGGTGSADFKKLNPFGKVPALHLDNGQVIAESEIINEYLEDKFPEKPLLPREAEGRARVRAASRLNDLYLDPPFRALLPQLFGRKLEETFIQEKFAEINGRLDQLETVIGNPRVAGESFSLADAAIAPTIFLMVNILPQFGAKSPLEGRPKIAGWWTRIQQRPSTKNTLEEQQAALAAMTKK